MGGDPALNKMIAGFTQEGTPLNALIGNKLEWGVTTLVAGMLANENIATNMTAEEMVDGAINYYNVIQERLGYYQQHQANSLERLL
jgi:hypothetical protein